MKNEKKNDIIELIPLLVSRIGDFECNFYPPGFIYSHFQMDKNQ